MTTDNFVKMLANRSGFTKWDVYKILSEMADLIEEEVFENGDNISIGGLGQFKQVIVRKRKKEFKILSFRPTPSMNNESWHEWFKY